MIAHVAGLFSHPSQEWKSIRDDYQAINPFSVLHGVLLAAIPPLCMFIGTTRVGWNISANGPVMLTEASAAVMALFMYVAMLAGIVFMGIFIHWMSRNYDARPSRARAIMFAAYTATPLFLAGLVALYPHVVLFMLVGIAAIFYTVYLLYTGVPIFMNISEEEGFVYASAILTVGLVMLVAMLAITVLIWSVGLGPVYTW